MGPAGVSSAAAGAAVQNKINGEMTFQQPNIFDPAARIQKRSFDFTAGNITRMQNAAAGVTDLCLRFAGDDQLAQMERFTAEVLPALA